MLLETEEIELHERVREDDIKCDKCGIIQSDNDEITFYRFDIYENHNIFSLSRIDLCEHCFINILELLDVFGVGLEIRCFRNMREKITNEMIDESIEEYKRIVSENKI